MITVILVEHQRAVVESVQKEFTLTPNSGSPSHPLKTGIDASPALVAHDIPLPQCIFLPG